MVKPVNYDKVQEITQEKDKNPAVFLSRVTEAFRKSTNTDPESAEGRSLLAMHFITQSSPHIRRKLQKLEAGPQTPSSTLVEEAFKVYNNEDMAKEANTDRRLIKETQLLAALIHPPS